MINKIIGELKGLSIEELGKLQEHIVKEKDTRGCKKTIYTHDCFGSSDYHFRKYKHFAKKITSIDGNKTNGYAFSGEFLDVRKENLVVTQHIIPLHKSQIKLA